MEGRLVPADGSSSLDVLHILVKLQSVGFCSGLDHNSGEPCFEHILSVFLKELQGMPQIPPFPVMLGIGRPMDLYKFYGLVSELGGYDSVTDTQSWALVAERIGLDSGLGCPLKLVYAKYLNALERCLRRASAQNLGVSVGDSEWEARSLFQEIMKQKRTNGADFTLSPPSKRVQLLTPPREKEQILIFDNGECERTNGSTTFVPTLPNVSFSSLKRKRQQLVGMLDWMKYLAKNPIDQSIGKILPSDGLNAMKNMVGEQYSLAFQARKVLFLKKIRNVAMDASTLQSKQKMCSTIHNSCKAAASSSFNSVIQSKQKMCSTIHNSFNAAANSSFKPSRNLVTLPGYLEDCVPIRVPVGSSFQVKVRPWTPITCYNSEDLKWLGRRIWPPENHEAKLPTEHNLIGKGREDDGCECSNPGSIECVRFHVAEKRLQLKCKLGAAFYAWRFHFMGEEVALSWKEEEERIFKETFRLNRQPASKILWQQLHSCFPSRERRSLVSYYFNVFVLTLRSYQNRASPNNVDSDDEENRFGFLSSSFGFERVKFRDTRSIVCSQNSQCVDLGD
ncbi:AT-rich interactive domain-containing protein 2 [Platanthera guangdongensis]|uniref:AT-rich interactive domain-containing protein 2 n=1 Tax=Platanthera guangdongensis TaxID=2320717 RepID=A0ABR2M134_9ASPA